MLNRDNGATDLERAQSDRGRLFAVERCPLLTRHVQAVRHVLDESFAVTGHDAMSEREAELGSEPTAAHACTIPSRTTFPESLRTARLSLPRSSALQSAERVLSAKHAGNSVPARTSAVRRRMFVIEAGLEFVIAQLF